MTVSNLDKYLDNKDTINGIDTIIMKVNDLEINELKTIVDELINRLGNGIVFFANIKGESVNFICKCNGVNSQAGLLVKKAALMSNGRGGGSATFAQGGSSEVNNIDEILKAVREDIESNK